MNSEFDIIMHSKEILSGPRNKYSVVDLLGTGGSFVGLTCRQGLIWTSLQMREAG